jgi:hypothetical protein
MFVTLMLAAGVAIAAGSTPANFDPQVTSPLARAIMEGVILGTNPCPFTSIDTQARLQLRSTFSGALGLGGAVVVITPRREMLGRSAMAS